MKIAFIQDLIMSMEPMGIAYLSSVLKENDCSVKYFEVTRRGFLDKLKAFRPDILAYTVFSTNYTAVGEINRLLKKEFPGAFSMVGGPHCTYSPQYIEEFSDIDGLCLGEGEEALKEFINLYKNGREYLGVKNWWFRKDGRIIKNEIRPLMEDLDTVSFPDIDVISEENRFLKKEPIRRMLTSRGCFFHCSYCHNQTFQELYKGKGSAYRSRSVDNIIKEALQLKQKYNPKMIFFIDDIFAVRLDLEEFAYKYKKEVDIPFSFNAHSDLVSENYASKIKEAGGCIVTIGLENIDERITTEILNRHYHPKRLAQSISYLKKAGLKVLANVIIGNPGETFEVALKSYKFCIDNKLDGTTTSILRPYPHTAVYEYCQRNNLLEENPGRRFHSWGTSMIKFKNKSEKHKIENFQKIFDFLVIYPRLFFLFRPIIYLPYTFILDFFYQMTFHYTKFRFTYAKFGFRDKYYLIINILGQFRDSMRKNYASLIGHN